MSVILLIIGFVLLIKGADLFVEGSAGIAKKFNVPSIIIGLTIVAMGTSAPEAVISVTSALSGLNDMSVANVIGSNLFNTLVVLGICSILGKLTVTENIIKKETPFLIMISILLLLFTLDFKLQRFEGIILLLLFVYFLYYTIKLALSSVNDKNDKTLEIASTEVAVEKANSIPVMIIKSIIGLASIIIGGEMVVNSATVVATSLGMSDNLVGLTIMAVGTSLPELVTSLIAVRKGERDIAIGNVIGSNLFNILLVLSLSVSISPMTVTLVAIIDIIFMIFATLLLFFMIKKDKCLIKNQGFVLVLIYIAYMIYTIMR